MKMTNSSRLEEQIENIYKRLAAQHHDGFIFMRDKIHSNPDYFDNDYRNLNSYVKQSVHHKLANLKEQEEDYYAMQQDFHKELKRLMKKHNINID